MSKIWIVSDTHFNHKRIIEYASRPFDNIIQMNKTLVKNWNELVKKEDKVFHLGDIGFGTTEEMQKFFQNMNGYKILIRGNHDKRFSDGALRKIGFSEIYKYPIIIQEFYMLSHAPLFLNNAMPYVNIHGHIHEKSIIGANYINACVEHTNYKPINFNSIKKKFQAEINEVELPEILEKEI